MKYGRVIRFVRLLLIISIDILRWVFDLNFVISLGFLLLRCLLVFGFIIIVADIQILFQFFNHLLNTLILRVSFL